MRRRAERVQRRDGAALRREVDVVERGAPVHQVQPRARLRRQRFGQRRRQLRKRLVHQRALHLGRQMSGLLVDRHDAPGVQRLVLPWLVAVLLCVRRPRGLVRAFGQDLILRVLQLQAMRRQVELAVEDDALVRMEDVVEERLVEPDRAQRAGAVAHQHLEDLEARPPRRTQAGADHLADDGRRRSRTQGCDRLERSAVLVADREAVEKVLHRRETDALQVRGAPRAHTLHVLEWRLEVDHGRCTRLCTIVRQSDRRVAAGRYWTMVAVPGATRISRICAGSGNGSSMLIPSGSSGVRE